MIGATRLVDFLLRDEPATCVQGTRRQTYAREGSNAALNLVGFLLGDEPRAETPISEASVHLPKHSGIWQAVFTGKNGGQTWRSTGLTNREQALRLARRWEAEAKAQRTKLGRTAKQAIWRVRRSSSGIGPLTQAQVAARLGMTERGVRMVQHRALRKLRQNPGLWQAWRQYLAAKLHEDQCRKSGRCLSWPRRRMIGADRRKPHG